ncbi:MAG: hypothetical protein WAK55_21300 [Xanthobacteraceae bacterium]
MIPLKSLTIVTALLAGGTSLAMAQNGPPTGGEAPVAGGAGGGPGHGYGAPGYFGAPAYLAAPGYVTAPGYAAPGYAVAPPRNLSMSAPGIRHKRLETGQPGPKQPHAAQ